MIMASLNPHLDGIHSLLTNDLELIFLSFSRKEEKRERELSRRQESAWLKQKAIIIISFSLMISEGKAVTTNEPIHSFQEVIPLVWAIPFRLRPGRRQLLHQSAVSPNVRLIHSARISWPRHACLSSPSFQSITQTTGKKLTIIMTSNLTSIRLKRWMFTPKPQWSMMAPPSVADVLFMSRCPQTSNPKELSLSPPWSPRRKDHSGWRKMMCDNQYKKQFFREEVPTGWKGGSKGHN